MPIFLILQIGPGLVVLNFQTSLGPLKLIQVVTPVEPLIQKVVHRIYCPSYMSLYASIVLFMESVMVRFIEIVFYSSQ